MPDPVGQTQKQQDELCFAAMKSNRNSRVRIEKAANATAPAVINIHPVTTTTTTTSPSPVSSSPRITYHSTGTNTPPVPPLSPHFSIIYGRPPTEKELRPPIVRFTRPLEPHELAYGRMFAAPLDPTLLSPETTLSKTSKRKYEEAEFQTDSFASSKMAIVRAKVRASLLVKKYGKIAEQDGWKVWAENNGNKVIHSEQVPVKIQLDDKGNIVDGTGVVGVSLLANLYREEIPLEKKRNDRQKEEEAPKPILAITPSKREDEKNPDAVEDYGGEDGEEQLYDDEVVRDSTDDEQEGMPAKKRRRSDRVKASEFIVWDPSLDQHQDSMSPLPAHDLAGQKKSSLPCPTTKDPASASGEKSTTPRKRKRPIGGGDPPLPAPPSREQPTSPRKCKRSITGGTPPPPTPTPPPPSREQPTTPHKRKRSSTCGPPPQETPANHVPRETQTQHESPHPQKKDDSPRSKNAAPTVKPRRDRTARQELKLWVPRAMREARETRSDTSTSTLSKTLPQKATETKGKTETENKMKEGQQNGKGKNGSAAQAKQDSKPEAQQETNRKNEDKTQTRQQGSRVRWNKEEKPVPEKNYPRKRQRRW